MKVFGRSGVMATLTRECYHGDLVVKMRAFYLTVEILLVFLYRSRFNLPLQLLERICVDGKTIYPYIINLKTL